MNLPKPSRLSLAAIVAAGLLPAASASAAATYSPGAQGGVGVAATYIADDATYDAIDGPSAGDVNHVQRDTVKGTSTASAASSLFAPAIPEMPPVWTACTDGCADAQAIAAAHADVAAGTLEAYGRAYAFAFGAGHSALGDTTARAYVDDVITVSKDTTVHLRGHITGHLKRTRDTDDQQAPTSRLDVLFQTKYCGSDGCDFALDRSYAPDMFQTLDVDEDFDVPVTLEAGQNPFNARLDSFVDTITNGDAHGTSTFGIADGHSGDGGGQKVTFQIVAPDDVAISSTSGKLPIVGGKSQTPTDTTPPTLTVPASIAVDATSPNGAAVTYQTSATDESGTPTVTCTPASASTFAIGTTDVACVAKDAAGNQTTKTFTVTVRGADAQLAALKARIATLGKKAQQQLTPHAKLTCDGLKQVSKKAGDLLKQGELTAVDAATVSQLAGRLAATIGC